MLKVAGKGSGRVSLAGMIATKPGMRTRMIYRTIVHHGRKDEKPGFREHDFAALLDAAHQQLRGPIVLVWDNSTQHVDKLMRTLISIRSAWLTVYRPTPPNSTPSKASGPTSNAASATSPHTPPTNSPP